MYLCKVQLGKTIRVEIPFQAYISWIYSVGNGLMLTAHKIVYIIIILYCSPTCYMYCEPSRSPSSNHYYSNTSCLMEIQIFCLPSQMQSPKLAFWLFKGRVEQTILMTTLLISFHCEMCFNVFILCDSSFWILMYERWFLIWQLAYYWRLKTEDSTYISTFCPWKMCN